MRQIALIAAKAAVSIGLLYFALSRTDFSAVGARLNQLNYGWVLFTLLLLGLQLILISIRWSAIAERCGATLTLLHAFRLSLIGAFFSQVLPSTVGGDAVRVWLFARDGAGWTKATHSVLLDRFVGVLALALVVVIGLPWAFDLIGNPVGRAVLVVIGGGSIAAGVAFIALGSCNWTWMQKFWPTRQVAELATTAFDLFKSVGRGALLMTLSIPVHILTAAAAWSAARAAGVPLEFAHALLLLPPVALIATIPVSIAGWGVRESALMLAFAYAGLSQTDGLVVSILFGAAHFAIGILGGATWLLGGQRLSLSAMRQSIPPSAP